MQFKNILVTTDFSDLSMCAFKVASQLASSAKSKITLLTILQDWVVPPTLIEQLPLPDKIDEYRSDVLKSTETRLKELTSTYFPGLSAKSEAILSVKSDANEIVEYAKKHGCDLIIMTGHGRGALKTALLGSVTQKVISLSHCPVLVVPAASKN